MVCLVQIASEQVSFELEEVGEFTPSLIEVFEILIGGGDVDGAELEREAVIFFILRNPSFQLTSGKFCWVK